MIKLYNNLHQNIFIYLILQSMIQIFVLFKSKARKVNWGGLHQNKTYFPDMINPYKSLYKIN